MKILNRNLLLLFIVVLSQSEHSIAKPLAYQIRNLIKIQNSFQYLDTIKLDTILFELNRINKISDTLSKAQAFEKLGQICFNEHAIYSVAFFDSAQVYYGLAQNLGKKALCTQNIAFVYDEKLARYNNALEYARKAFNIWQNLSSIQNQANMSKYIGFLHGQLGQYDSAFIKINDAIEKFEEANNLKGIAVCYFDMSLVYKKINIDSCLHYATLSKDIWTTYNAQDRIMKLNNLQFAIYLEIDNIDAINKIIKENIEITEMNSKNKNFWNDIDIFFDLCITYYSKIQDIESIKSFKLKQKEYKTLRGISDP